MKMLKGRLLPMLVIWGGVLSWRVKKALFHQLGARQPKLDGNERGNKPLVWKSCDTPEQTGANTHGH
jgi:hypothetical protein